MPDMGQGKGTPMCVCLPQQCMHPYHSSACIPTIVVHASLPQQCMHAYHNSICIPTIAVHACLPQQCMHAYYTTACMPPIPLYASLPYQCVHPYHYKRKKERKRQTTIRCSTLLQLITHPYSGQQSAILCSLFILLTCSATSHVHETLFLCVCVLRTSSFSVS